MAASRQVHDMDPRSVITRALTNAFAALFFASISVLGSGCGTGSDPGADGHASPALPAVAGDDAAAHAGHLDPDSFPEGQACTLTLDTSKEDDLRAVFGEPYGQQPAGSGKTLRYLFSDGSEWLFFLSQDQIWVGFTIQSNGAAVASPACWAPDGGYWQRPDGGYWQRPDGGPR